MNGKAMYNLTYGLFVLTAKDGAKDNGCIVNTVSQVTTEPNRICVAVNKLNFTHDMIHKTGEFNVSILTEGSKFETYKHFGFQSGKDIDKMEAIDFKRAANGIAYIANETNAFISAKVVSETDWALTHCSWQTLRTGRSYQTILQSLMRSTRNT